MLTQIRRAVARQGKRRSIPSPLAAAARVACERLETRTLFAVFAGPDTFTTNAGAPVVFSGPQLLANDTDVRSVSGFTQPAHGTVTTNPDGLFTYTPAPGFSGTDSFSYVARGGSAGVVDFQSVDAQGRALSLGQVSVGSIQFAVGRGISSPTGGSKDRETTVPSFSDVTFSTEMSAASPKLLAAVGTGDVVDRAVVTTYDSAGQVTDVLTLNGVRVTSDSISSGGGLPSESFSLSYSKIQFSHTERFAKATVTTATGYDLSAQKLTTKAAFVPSDLSASPPGLELSLGAKLDLAITSLQWGAVRPAPVVGGSGGGSAGPASVSEVTVTAEENEQTAALISAAAAGAAMDDITLTSRDADGHVVAEWTLDGVLVSGFSLSSGGGGTPSTSFSLNFTKITETYNKFDEKGQVATRSTSYDLGTSKASGPADFGKQQVNENTVLSFQSDDGGGLFTDLGQVALSSYQWGVGRGVGSFGPSGTDRELSPPSLSEFTLTADLSLATPQLFAAVTSGSPVDRVVLTETQNFDGVPAVVTTWTLHDVVVTGDSRSVSASGSESFSLAFAAFDYDFKKFEKGAVKVHTTTGYDLQTAKVRNPTSLGGSEIATGKSQLLLHLGPGADVELGSVQFGVGNTSGGSVLSDVVISAESGVESAAIITALLAGTPIPEATITRTNFDGIVVAEWDLHDVLLSSYQISSGGGGASESFTLSPEAVTATVAETSAGKVTGTATAKWDFAAQKGTAPNFGGANLGPRSGDVMEVSFGGQTSQVQLNSFQWAVANAAGGTGAPQHGSVAVSADVSPVSLGVFSAVAGGAQVPQVVITKLNANGEPVEKLTLTDVVFEGYSSSTIAGGTFDTFTLAYDAFEFDFFVRDSGGKLQRKVSTGSGAGAKASFGGSDLSADPPPLLVNFGPGGDVEVGSFSFGTGGSSRPSLGEFTLTSLSGAESAALLSAVEHHTSIPDVRISQRDANDNVISQWDLHDVLVTGYSQSDGGGTDVPSESFRLSAGMVTETFFRRDAKGKLVGAPVSASWDTAKHTLTSPPDFGGEPVAGVNTATGLVTVNVVPAANTAPTAAPVTAATFENGPAVTVAFAGADADAGDTLTYSIVTGLTPAQGGLALNGDGTFTFDPGADFADLGQGDARSVSFTYQATDSHGAASGPATVTIAVSGVNTAPSFVAGPNQLITDRAGPQTLVNWATGIVAGPGAEAGQGLHFIVTTDNPGLFTAGPAIDPAGTLTYTTTGTGLAHVTVTLRDNGGTGNGGADTSAAAQFDISVIDPPIHVTGRPVSAVEATPLVNAVFATLTDDDPLGGLDEYVATIDYGDGSVRPATVVADPSAPGQFLVLGSTTYALRGSAVARVVVRDGGGSSDAATVPVTIADAPLTAAPVHVTATAGAPFSGPVATFTSGNPADPLGDFSATIAWGDGSVTPAVITRSATGAFSVAGSHVYAAAGSYPTTVTIVSVGGSRATTADNSTVTPLGRAIRRDQVAGHGFWHSKPGQALISSFNGGPSSTALGNWLAATLPNLFGAAAGAGNTTNATNARVAALYLSLLDQRSPRLEAEILATALNVYATTAGLGGQAGRARGFFIDDFGLGAASYSAGPGGSLLGLPGTAPVTVYQALRAADARATGGVLFAGDVRARRQANGIFEAINSGGF